jgi:hypothetical protein
MTSQWQPFHEPLRATLLRTGAISIAVGAVLAGLWGGLARWPLATLLALWPALGGHWVEVWFLNWLRPRLSHSRVVQIAARAGVWFAGGTILAVGMSLTARAFGAFSMARWPAWWLGGVAFTIIELAAHLGLQIRGRPSFYNGRG